MMDDEVLGDFDPYNLLINSHLEIQQLQGIARNHKQHIEMLKLRADHQDLQIAQLRGTLARLEEQLQ